MAIQMDQARARNAGRVEILALSPHEWRISDSSIPVGDAGSVLGFAEKVCDGRGGALGALSDAERRPSGARPAGVR